ncbi:phosphatidate cytidylyltransferase [Sphingobacterium sp. LRF_L2]|uniref:phosphatidate cytidylyltransferase n=1 Tax=Sphingobacterium sp. LRF_L2 TaxID=3369421 RepID=UPI003F647480
MRTRAITGFFFIAVLIGAVLFGAYSFLTFFSIIGTASVYEFYKMVQAKDKKPLIFLGTAAACFALVLWSLVILGIIGEKNLLWVLVMILFIYIAALFRKRSLPIEDISYSLFGIIYAAVPFGIFMSLGFINGIYNAYIPLGFLILLWTNDTGAYLAGRSFGRRKLFERISPNKTWEGFIGGVLLAVVVALNLAQYFGSLLGWQWVCMAFIIGIFGTCGDLVESMLKRNLGVKDSGNLLPGHGGLLDRFDGLLMAAPLVYMLLKFVVF